MAWTTTDTRLNPSVSSTPKDLHMEDDTAPDEQVHSSDDEDIGNDHIPKVNLTQDWWKPLSEEDRPATPEPAWSIPSSDLPVPINNWDPVIMSAKTTTTRWLARASHNFKLTSSLNKDLEYLRKDGLKKNEAMTLLLINLWIKNLVIRQQVEDFQLGIESYQTQLNLTKPRWDATGFEFKHDFTVIDSSRAITFRDKYVVLMIMRFNEIHKFSDGTLQPIDELDYRVKEFKVNKMNSSLNT
ncbi:hypothetical protein Tco_0667924 [Tanacetum coccineum]